MMTNNRRNRTLAALIAYGLLCGEDNRTVHTMNDSSRPGYKKPIPAGCKEYTIDGITVVAISEKSARRKVAKRLEAHNG